MEELKTLADKLQVNDSVFFLGSMRHDKVFEWLKNLDIFALACKRDSNGDADGIPVVLMEAMEYGVPVISTYITGLPELIENGVSGLLSQPGDEKAFADNLKKFLSDKTDREKMVQNAKKRVEEEFSKEVNTERIYEIIME